MNYNRYFCGLIVLKNQVFLKENEQRQGTFACRRTKVR